MLATGSALYQLAKGFGELICYTKILNVKLVVQLRKFDLLKWLRFNTKPPEVFCFAVRRGVEYRVTVGMQNKYGGEIKSVFVN